MQLKLGLNDIHSKYWIKVINIINKISTLDN